MKRGLVAFIVVPLLLLTGCGDNWLGSIAKEDSDEAKRYEITMALDQGDYSFVISKLESSAYGFTEEERNMNLAAANLGQAGFDIPTLTNDMIEAGDEAAAGQDSSQVFLSKLSSKATGGGLAKMKTASGYFSKVYNGTTSGVNCGQVKTANPALYESLSNLQKDACYNEGLTELVRGFSAIGVAISNITSWMNPTGCDDSDADSVADSAEAAACAILWGNTGACTDPGVIGTPVTVNFTSPSFSVSALLIRVTSTKAGCSNNNFYELVYTPSAGVKSPVVTSGYCGTDFTTCTAPNYSSPATNTCWPCPLTDGEKPLTYTNTIIDAINTGGDSITAITGDSTTSDSTGDFRTELCGSADCTVTDTDIATYLTQQ